MNLENHLSSMNDSAEELVAVFFSFKKSLVHLTKRLSIAVIYVEYIINIIIILY